MARGLALFLGAFTLLNCVGPDANIWWIDLWPLPPLAGRVILVAFALSMILFAFGLRWRSHRFLIALILLFALANTARYYVLLSKGSISSEIPIPLSILVAASLIVILRDPKPRKYAVIATFAAAAIVFPLAQIALFGATDYRRPADVIVVFGARAYANGAPSDALKDRVRTAAQLYRAGLAPRLLFSGGPGEGPIDEPQSMRRYARQLGVPDTAILEDPHGINTEATVRNTLAVAGPKRILAVSHFYHLPRVKMTFQRYGAEVYTVPSGNTVPGSMPFNLVREDAAFWAYYFRRL